MIDETKPEPLPTPQPEAAPTSGEAAQNAPTGTVASAVSEGDGPLGLAVASAGLTEKSLNASTEGRESQFLSDDPLSHVPAANSGGVTGTGDDVKSIIAKIRMHLDSETSYVRIKYHGMLDKLEAVLHRI